MDHIEFSDIAYDKFLSKEKLMGSKCTKCSSLYSPPRPICISCKSSEMEWLALSGRGRVAAFTCISIAPKLMLDEGFNRNNPYCVGVIELEEGTRVVARIEGIDPKNPENIEVGTPVHVKFLHCNHGNKSKTFLAFEAD